MLDHIKSARKLLTELARGDATRVEGETGTTSELGFAHHVETFLQKVDAAGGRGTGVKDLQYLFDACSVFATSLSQWIGSQSEDQQMTTDDNPHPDPPLLLPHASSSSSYATTDHRWRELRSLMEDILVLKQKTLSMFEWQDGPLTKSMRSGDLILLDEANLAEDAVLERLNSVLEPSRSLVLAEKGGEKVDEVIAHAKWRLFATMNPGARGVEHVSGLAVERW